MSRLKELAARLKLETLALWFAYKDPRTPWYAKAWAALVAAYAFSPIDLIPDFIPVLGYLDDAILVPLGIAIAVRLIPTDVYAECKTKARQRLDEKRPRNWIMGALIVTVWVAVLVLVAWLVVRAARGPGASR